jgi:mono/diheme cytochrome c family protein
MRRIEKGDSMMNYRRSGVPWLAVWLLVLFVAPLQAQQKGPMPGSATTPVEQEGRRLFVQRCAVCHLPLTPEPRKSYGPSLNGVLKTNSEDLVRQAIMAGSANMPGWRYTLTAEQIDSVIAYLKTFTN